MIVLLKTVYAEDVMRKVINEAVTPIIRAGIAGMPTTTRAIANAVSKAIKI